MVLSPSYSVGDVYTMTRPRKHTHSAQTHSHTLSDMRVHDRVITFRANVSSHDIADSHHFQWGKAHLSGMACDDDSKAVTQRRAAASGWLVTVADANGVTTPSDEMQCRCAGADRLVDLANGMVPTWAPLERPFPSLGNCAGPQHVVGVDTMVATLQKAFFEEPSKRGVRLRGPQVRANRPSHGLTLLRTMAATQAGLSG